MRVKAFIAAAVVAALAGPALAQQQAPIQRYGEKDKEKSDNEKQLDKDAERAYKRSLDAVPEKAPVDPWGIARGADTPKAAAKPAAKSAAKSDAKLAPVKPKTTTGEPPK
jgi:hypothetical protein